MVFLRYFRTNANNMWSDILRFYSNNALSIHETVSSNRVDNLSFLADGSVRD